MTYDIDAEIARLQARADYGMDTYAEWRALAELILAYIDIEEGRYGRRTCEDCGAGWGS